LSSTIPPQQFDIILANINRNVILHYLPFLKKSLHDKSLLLLSGLLATDQEDIVKACTDSKLDLVRQIEKNNWISLLLNNRIG
jgi:ribosomal protein L11 methyltransferase